MARHRIGIIGLSHDHVWSLIEQWKGLPDVEIVGAGLRAIQERRTITLPLEPSR